MGSDVLEDCKRGRLIERVLSFIWDCLTDYPKYIMEEIRNKGREEDEFIFVSMEQTRDNINAAMEGHIKVLGSQ